MGQENGPWDTDDEEGASPWLGNCCLEPCPLQQGFGSDPLSGHKQESTDECINKRDNKSMFLSLSLSVSLSLSNQLKNKKEMDSAYE